MTNLFELRLAETNTILKAGTLAMCQAIQTRNNIQEVSYILPIRETNPKRKSIIKLRTLLLIVAVVALVCLI